MTATTLAILDRAIGRLNELATSCTPAPWVPTYDRGLGEAPDAVVSTSAPENSPVLHAYYGGRCVGESIRPADQQIITAFGPAQALLLVEVLAAFRHAVAHATVEQAATMPALGAVLDLATAVLEHERATAVAGG